MRISNLSNNRIIYIVAIILCAFGVVIALVSVFTKTSDNNSANNSLSESANRGYFVPPQSTPEQTSYTGMINEIFDAPKGSRIKYVLTDEKGEKIIYIYSINNDLSLSVGVKAEVTGKADEESYNGLKVFNVRTIKLK